MDLMGRAGFQSVFIGIESPNEESLRETKKLQNVRPAPERCSSASTASRTTASMSGAA